MERDKFRKFCDEWKRKGAIDFTRSSHYEEMSPLLEPHAEVVEVRKDEFHKLTGSVYYPRKETSDKLGKAAGISFSGNVSVVKQNDGAWVGTAYPQELGPDGKMVVWAPASYEFNPSDRAEEELLRKAGNSPVSEQALKLKTLEYKKVALRRADTGARAAAIISAIGMPTGFRSLFGDNDPPDSVRYFLFSRVIVNTKNELVLNRALDSMFGTQALLASPAEALAAPASEPAGGDPPMRNANEPSDVGEMSAAQLAALDAAADAGFGDFPTERYIATERDIENMAKDHTPRGRVLYIRWKYDKDLPNRGKGMLMAAIDDDRTTDDRFKHLYELAAPELAKKGITLPAW